MFGAVAVLGVAVVLTATAGDILLLTGIGLIGALAIHGVAVPAARLFRLPHSMAVVLILILGVMLVELVIWVAAPGIVREIEQLRADLPEAAGVLRRRLARQPWWGVVERGLPETSDALAQGRALLKRLPGVIAGTAGVLASMLVMLLVSVSVALEPGTYRDGLLRLVPKAHRPRASLVLERTAHAMRWWLLQQLLMATIIGVTTTVGLWLLGVPLAFVLGLLAAVLAFIPNIGPLLSAIPPVLLAAMHGLRPALYVASLYIVIQASTSYILTPILQRKLVSLPPALTIVVQLIMGVLFGALGVALGAPVTVLLMVMVRTVYIEGVLGDTDEAQA